MPLMHVQQNLSNKLETMCQTLYMTFLAKGQKSQRYTLKWKKIIINWNAHHQAEPLITWECFVNSLHSQIHWLQTPPHGQDATIA